MKNILRSTRVLALTSTVLLLLLCTLFLLSPPGQALVYAQPDATRPNLGTAGSFAVLGASTVTNTGPTTLNGNLGVSPGSAITGFPPGKVHGTIHKADAVALQAQGNATTAYVNAAGQACNHNLTGQDLGGKALTPGIYCFSSSAQLTGQLTLDGQGNSASIFIFQVGSTLTTASNSSVKLINSASACSVFWQIGSSATLGTDTRFVGSILAQASITATTGAVSNGGLYARSGAVTLDSNTISRASCGGGGGTPTPRASSTSRLTMKPTATPSRYPGMPNTGSDPNRLPDEQEKP